MPSPLGSTLYTDGERYFLIPDDLFLPDGDQWMTDVAGNERNIASETAARFEVSEEQADAWIQLEFARVGKQTLEALASALTALPDVSRDPDARELIRRALQQYGEE